MTTSRPFVIVRNETDTSSEEGIRAKYVPAELYRVSRYKYPPGTRFSAVTREQTMHVMIGKCRITMMDESVLLSAGHVVELAGGNYDFEVVGTVGVEYVSVWPLYKWLPSLKPE